VWLVTGASSGFVRAIAEAALAAVGTVAAEVRQPSAVGTVVAEVRQPSAVGGADNA
jgi:NAD(P)-dependent dehydrogenase (short-subunit alcohol dehydrogenase family)